MTNPKLSSSLDKCGRGTSSQQCGASSPPSLLGAVALLTSSIVVIWRSLDYAGTKRPSRAPRLIWTMSRPLSSRSWERVRMASSFCVTARTRANRSRVRKFLPSRSRHRRAVWLTSTTFFASWKRGCLKMRPEVGPMEPAEAPSARASVVLLRGRPPLRRTPLCLSPRHSRMFNSITVLCWVCPQDRLPESTSSIWSTSTSSRRSQSRSLLPFTTRRGCSCIRKFCMPSAKFCTTTSSPTTGSYPERMERTSPLLTLDAPWTFPRPERATTSRSSSPAMKPPTTWPVRPCATKSRGASRPTPMASLLRPSFSCTDLIWTLLRRRMGSGLPPRS
mmetsp:Transcript_27836/g.65346  ORF Transcript_27836/g.65346 Transcript_27836/m.65346 type:complete len:333 (+) Transcript_27836:591-1589(+)